MPNKINIKFILVVAILLTFSIQSSYSQDVSNDSIEVADTSVVEDYDFNFYMFDFSYTNNKPIDRRETSENTPAFLTDFSFLHKSGLYADFNYTKYLNRDTSSYDIDLTLGFQKELFKEKFDFDINYEYHQYTGEEDLKGIDYKHTININAGFNYKLIRIYADGDFYLDNKNYFNEFGLSNTIDFDGVFYDNDFIMLQPSVSFTFGTDHWLYSIYEPYIENNESFLRTYLHNQGYNVAELTNREIFDLYLVSRGIDSSTYCYHGVDFLVPFTYSAGSVAFTVAWMYSIPSDKFKAFGMREQSGYIVSLSFIF